MTTVTLRSQKAQPLTNQEIDDNFSNLNSNKLESVVYSSCTTSGSGWFRVATTSSDGRGTYNVDIYTTGGNHNPSVLTVHAQGDWSSARILYALWDQQFPASSVRITRSATNTYLEVNFTVSVNTFQIRVNHVGHNTNILGYSGALSAGGDTVCDSVQLIGYVNTSKIYASDVHTSIVYDSDNTSYYLNPASTSILNALTVGGSSVWTQATLTNLNQLTNGPGYLTSNQTISISGDATGSGSTSIALTLANSGVTAGTYNTLTVDAKGRVTSGSNTSYLTAESDTLASVTARGASTSTALTLSSNSNRLGNLYVGYGTYSNSITPVGDSNINLDTPSGAVYVTTSIRSPIFYDSNDTSYYTDPAGTSNLNRLDLNTLFLDRNESPSRGISWYSSGYTSWSQYMSPAGTSGSGPTGNITAPSGTYVTSWALRSFIENASGYGWTFESGTGAGQPTVVAEIRSSDGLAKFNGGTYSPIFYDSDNTGYYIDPASTSIFNNAGFGVGSPSSGDRVEIVGALRVHTGNNWDAIKLYTDGANGYIQGLGDETGLHIRSEYGNIYLADSRGDVRMPMFYDVNDTNYYVDPASTSILNVARINSIQSPNSTSVVAADSAMPNSGHSFIHTLAQGPGGNDGHIFGMTWSGTTSSYGAQLWLDTDPTNKMSLRSRSNGGVWNSWADVITSWSDDQVKTGYFQSNSSLRAPIFYDSNDTNYYLDPASTSNINALTVAGNLNAYASILSVNRINFTNTSGSQESDPYCIRWVSEGSARGNGLSWLEFQLNDDSHEEIRIYGNSCVGYGCGQISDNLYHRFRADGYAWNSGTHQSDGDKRAPIFYDSNDTGYYVDPNSTSNLYNLTLGGRNMRTFENNSYIEFYVEGDANTYYPVRFDVYAWFHWGRWSISRGYSDTAPWDPIGTGAHRGGLTFTWEWSGDGAWGGNDHNVRVVEWTEQYTTMIGGMALSVNGMIVWLRGGHAYYRFHGPGGMNNSATPYYSTYTASNGGTYAPRANASSAAGEINYRYPVRNNSQLYENDRWVLHEEEWQNGKYFSNTGIIYANSSHRAPTFYDLDDTGYYLDPATDRSTNINGFTSRTVEATKGTYKYNTPRYIHTSDTNYWTGIMGWGTNDLNTVMTWGSGFFDTWSNPGNQPSGNSHWVGVQAYHYVSAANSGYGWQMCGGPIGNLRFRNSWPTNSGWKTVPVLDVNDTNGGTMYAGSYVAADDTGYYCDPNGTNRLNFVNSNNHYIQPGYMLYSDHGGWTGEYNKIQWHSSHLYLQNNGGGYLLILRRGDGGERFYCDYSGNVTASGNITAYSDRSLKENILTIQNPLQLVNKLRGVTFDWIETKKPSYGLIAQEVEQVIPELVLEIDTGTTETDSSKKIKTVDYGKMVSVLIEAIKEQQQQIDELKNLVKQLVQ